MPIIIGLILIFCIACGKPFVGCKGVTNKYVQYICEKHNHLFFSYIFDYRNTPIVNAADDEHCSDYTLAFYSNGKIHLCKIFHDLPEIEKAQTILHEFRHADLKGWEIKSFNLEFFTFLDSNTYEYFSRYGVFYGNFYTNTARIPHFPHSQCKRGFFKGGYACDPVSEENNHGSYSMDVIFLTREKKCNTAFVYLTERINKASEYLNKLWLKECGLD